MSNERDSQIPTNLTSSTATPNESSNEEEMDFQDYIDLSDDDKMKVRKNKIF